MLKIWVLSGIEGVVFIPSKMSLKFLISLLRWFFTDWLHGAESYLRSMQCLSYSRNSLLSVEPEGSLSSWEPAIGPCPKADESTAHISFCFLSDPFYSDPVTKAKIFNVVSPIEIFPPKLCVYFCSASYLSCFLSSFLHWFEHKRVYRSWNVMKE
jgi:hypothetical protein